MDILLIGSDDREGGSVGFGRSDTLMLVHIDSQEDYVSVLSLPRDLKVKVPGEGTQKINAAYAFGGPALAMETVLQLTGVRVDNFVNVSFDAFREMTAALGGIYVDVDTRYYNGQNADWESIDIWPGYQRLSGEDALDYVRFRHDLNYDFGRIDRQQRFLRAAKEQALGWDLVIKGPQLVSLLASNVSTEISTAEALRLVVWAIGLNGSRIKQVYLEVGAATVDGVSYIVATDEAVQAAISDLVVAPGGKPASVSPMVARVAPDLAAEQRSTATAATTTSTTAGTADLTQVSVDVLNANRRTGEAAVAADRLRAVGATVDKVGDADRMEEQTIVAYPSGKKETAAEVAKVVGGGSLEADTTVKVITVFLGADFDPAMDPDDPDAGGTIPDQGEWKALAGLRPFALMAPSYIPRGFEYKDRRTYEIDTDSGPKPALKMVYQFEGSDQYLGIMETTFIDAPAALDGEKVTQERHHVHAGHLRGEGGPCLVGEGRRDLLDLQHTVLSLGQGRDGQDGHVYGPRFGPSRSRGARRLRVLLSPRAEAIPGVDGVSVVLAGHHDDVVSLARAGVSNVARRLSPAEIELVRRAFSGLGSADEVVGYVCSGRRLRRLAEGIAEPVGHLLPVRDHVNLTWVSPLAGPNDDSIGPRFTPIAGIYRPELVHSLLSAGPASGRTRCGGAGG